MLTLEIREDGCRGCEMCVDICPTKCLTYDHDAHKARVVELDDCIGCLSCRYLCPSGAIVHSDYHVVRNFYRDIHFSRRMEKFL